MLLFFHVKTAHGRSPVCPQVNAADAKVVARSDKAWMQLKGSRVSLHRFLAPVPVCQRGSQAIPQQIVLNWFEERVDSEGPDGDEKDEF